MATKHSRLAPSTFKAIEICPSFESDSEDSAASKRGDVLHDLLEKHGHKAIKHKSVQSMDERDVWQLERICEYIEPLEKVRGVTIHREYEFDLRPLGIPDCELGTGDLLIIRDIRADLIDFKFGWWEVDDAEVNVQAWLYVLGVFFNFPKILTVNAHILQPARDEISVATFRRSEIPKLLLRAKTIAARRQSKKKTYVPVYENCLWCDAKADCVVLHEMALMAGKYAQLKLPVIDLRPDQIVTSKFSGDAYDCADILEKWAKDVKHKLSTWAAETGSDVPGHTLVTKNGKRTIIDTILAQQILQNRFEIPLEEFLTAAEISVTAIDKIVAAKTPRGEKETRRKQVSDALIAEGIVVAANPYSYLIKDKQR